MDSFLFCFLLPPQTSKTAAYCRREQLVAIAAALLYKANQFTESNLEEENSVFHVLGLEEGQDICAACVFNQSGHQSSVIVYNSSVHQAAPSLG